MVNATRFASGDDVRRSIVRFIASPANLAREGSAAPRRGWSDFLRQAYERGSDPAGPHRRRGAGSSASPAARRRCWRSRKSGRRIAGVTFRCSPAPADTASFGLRIFTRDGQTMGRAPFPQPDSPNSDLMADFLNRRDGGERSSRSRSSRSAARTSSCCIATRSSRPSTARTASSTAQNRPAPGETEAAGQRAGPRAFAEMLASPFHEVWRSAALDEWTANLYERLLVGSLA